MLSGFDLCRAALAVVDVSSTEKNVLMVLSIMANDQAQCWPPISGPTGLTAKTQLSERAVQRAIQGLKALGHISRRQLRNGCLYTVHPREDASTPATETGDTVAGDAVTPATQAPRPATVAPKQPETTNTDDGGASAAPERVITGQRGRRIDIDWVPSKPLPEAIAKVVAGWPPGRVDEKLEEFRDFWLGDAGQRASKLDWDRTWWNRLRDIHDRDRQRQDQERRRDGKRSHPHRGQRAGHDLSPMARALVEREAGRASADD